MNVALNSFFEGLKAEPDLDQFVRDKREEDLYLEFKEKADPTHGDIDKDDRESFSKTVAAFANADGGVLIFGVATTKSPDSPDRAAGLKPIANVERFRAKLQDSILNTTQPPVDGVRLELIESAPGCGYLKCLVPASDRPPHRAMHALREYWRRTSNGCRRMEHYELEDVFGRRLRPVLRVQVELRPRPDPDPHEDLHFAFLNEGRGLARHAGLVCTVGEGRVVTVHSGALRNISALNNQKAMVQYYDPHVVVHPNGVFSSLGQATIKRDAKGGPIPLDVKWYAENMETRTTVIDLEANVQALLP